MAVPSTAIKEVWPDSRSPAERRAARNRAAATATTIECSQRRVAALEQQFANVLACSPAVRARIEALIPLLEKVHNDAIMEQVLVFDGRGGAAA